MMYADIYQTIAEFLTIHDIDSLRATCLEASTIVIPDRKWRVYGECGMKRCTTNLRKIILPNVVELVAPRAMSVVGDNIRVLDVGGANVTFTLPNLERLTCSNVPQYCINVHKTLRYLDVRGYRMSISFDLPFLEELLGDDLPTSKVINRHRTLKRLTIKNMADIYLPHLEEITVQYITDECLNRHKTLKKVILNHFVNIKDFDLPLLEELRSYTVSEECINRHRRLKVLDIYFNVDVVSIDLPLLTSLHTLTGTMSPSCRYIRELYIGYAVIDFDLPLLERLTAYCVSEECINRHKRLWWLDCGEVVLRNLHLPLLERLHANDVSNDCVDRHKTLKRLSSDSVNDFYLPLLERLTSMSVFEECVNRHKRLRVLKIAQNKNVFDFELPYLEVLFSDTVSEECIDRHKTLREIHVGGNVMSFNLPLLVTAIGPHFTDECRDAHPNATFMVSDY